MIKQKKIYFVTGTDTDAGKTYVTSKLLIHFKKQGLATLGLKPISAASQDPYFLQEASTLKLPMDMINPISLKIPAAPHIEANKMGLDLTVDTIIEKIQPALNSDVDVILIEGVGGWYVPINPSQTMADVVKKLDIEVIVVVGMKLGCLNHALLTTRAIEKDGLKIHGWIANCIDPNMGFLTENIEILSHKIKAPLLSKVVLNGEIEEGRN